MKKGRIALLIAVLGIVLYGPVGNIAAQESDQPVYIVQSGDTITTIAFQFGISPDDLIAANSLADPNNLRIGQELIIPGLEGVHGVLTAKTVGFGETLLSLTRRYQVSPDLLIRLNHITSPTELYVGSNLIIPQTEQEDLTAGITSVDSGQSLLEIAITHQSDPYTIQEVNSLEGSWAAIPGEPLFYPSAAGQVSNGAIFPGITAIEVNPLPLVQGKTIEIKITTPGEVSLDGSLLGSSLHFFPVDANTYVALQGIYALEQPGIYPFVIQVKTKEGEKYTYQQMIRVKSGNYAQDPRLIVDPATVDPKVTGPESDQISKIVSPVSVSRYWEGYFQSPGYDPKWITSLFGNRRQYNDDPTVYFHSGLDYGGGTGLPIKSPAAGVVVFTGQLTVRGNATIIDHGWGVYSGFWHQSEIQVKVGDRVEKGQQIGLVGGTGRVTGAHLHWEVWVNGIQVDPQDWVEKEYP